VKHEQDDLGSSFRDELLTDLELACLPGRSIRAHKVILACRSSYFKEIIKSTPQVTKLDMGAVPYELIEILVRLVKIYAQIVD